MCSELLHVISSRIWRKLDADRIAGAWPVSDTSWLCTPRLAAEAEDFFIYTPQITASSRSFRELQIRKRIPITQAQSTQALLPLIMASIREDDLPGMATTKTHTSISSTKKGVVIDDRALPPLLRDLGPEEIAVLEKKLKRKIDWRMMPTMIVLQIMNYLDRCVGSSHCIWRGLVLTEVHRNAIGAARLAGLENDLHLVGYEFQTCVTVLFVGYILMQVPSNLLLNRIGKPSIYLPTCMAVWVRMTTENNIQSGSILT